MDTGRSPPRSVHSTAWGSRPLAREGSSDMDTEGDETLAKQAMKREAKRQAPASALADGRPPKRSIPSTTAMPTTGSGPSAAGPSTSTAREQSSWPFRQEDMDMINAPRARAPHPRQSAPDNAPRRRIVTDIRGYESADELDETGDVTRTGPRPGIGQVEAHDLAFQMLFMKLSTRRRRG